MPGNGNPIRDSCERWKFAKHRHCTQVTRFPTNKQRKLTRLPVYYSYDLRRRKPLAECRCLITVCGGFPLLSCFCAHPA